MNLLNLPMELATYTPRIEKAGDGPGEPAASLTLKSNLGRDGLSQFFRTPQEFDAFSKLVWNDDGEVQCGITDLSLDKELIGGSASLALPMSQETLDFDKVDVKALQVSPADGHVAAVKVRVNLHPTEAQAGKLYSLQGKELLVTAVRKVADAEAAGQQSMRLPVAREAVAEAPAESNVVPMIPGQKLPQRPRGAKMN